MGSALVKSRCRHSWLNSFNDNIGLFMQSAGEEVQIEVLPSHGVRDNNNFDHSGR